MRVMKRMIEKTITSEFGTYKVKYNHGYPVHCGYLCIDSYEDVDDEKHWEKCPCCNLKPKVWEFDNGRQTACGCWESRYDIFSVKAESIMSVYRRTGFTAEYITDQLRLNWNEYCSTMINPCNHSDLRFQGKW